MSCNQILLAACGMYLRAKKYCLTFDNGRVGVRAMLQGRNRGLECLAWCDLSVRQFCLQPKLSMFRISLHEKLAWTIGQACQGKNEKYRASRHAGTVVDITDK